MKQQSFPTGSPDRRLSPRLGDKPSSLPGLVLRRSPRGLPALVLAGMLVACANGRPVGEPPTLPTIDRLDLSPSARPLPHLPPVTIGARSVTIDLQDGLSIDEAMAIAVIANPELRAVRTEREIAAAQIVQARLLPNPDLSIGFDQPAFGSTAGTSTALSAGISWEITSLITRNANARAAEATREAVQLDVAWQEWRVAIEARLQWRRLAATEQELAAARTSESDLRIIADTLSTAAASRDATAIEASTARSALDAAVLARMDLDREHDRARRDLARVLGLGLDASLVLQDPNSDVAGALPPRDRLEAELAQHRLDLLALRFGYESEQARLRAAVLSRFPRVSIGVTAARDATDVGTVGAGLTISLPVFDRAQGLVALESATRNQLRDEYAARMFAASTDLDDAYAEVTFARAALQRAEDTIPHLEQLVATYRMALSQHLVDVPNVYAAVDALNGRRVEVLRRRQEVGDLLTKIELASGQLLSSPLPNARINP